MTDDIATLMQQLQMIAAASADSADVADVEAGINLMVTRRAERQQAAERATKHAKLLPQCRAALDRFEELGRQLERAGLQLITVESQFESAENLLAQALDAEPRPQQYPTAQEMDAWRKRVAAAEAVVAERRESRRQAVQLRDELSVARLYAKDELAKLQWQEANYRPSAPQTPRQFIVGSIT